MSIFRIFPEKTATLYSEYPNENTGRDEIIEISSYYKGTESYVNRGVIAFNSSDIASVLESYVSSSNRNVTDFSASLKLYLASANEVPTSYTVYAYPVYTPSGSTNITTWVAGNGKHGDSPENTSGVSWNSTQSTGSGTWTSDVPTYVTSSYSGSTAGGGAWYTASNSYNLQHSQTHGVNSTHDINIDVTDSVKLHYAGDISNAGFILKLDDINEYQTSRQLYLRYFSHQTHTIYPPCLEVKWDDFVAGSDLNTVSDVNATIKLKNNRGTYTDEGFQKFELHVRPKYPVRTFVTSSNYLTNYYLPETSYWGLRDENTEEMVIDFDTTYTKLSQGSTGNYFTVHMGGLEPERYYRVLIKTTIDGSTIVVDNNMTFKVVRNG